MTPEPPLTPEPLLTVNNILTLLAMFLAPLFALQVTRWLDRQRERRERRMSVFRTLMATRAQKLGREHVEALNMIDVEFGQSTARDRNVVDAWKMYLDHLNRATHPDSGWGTKADELFTELLFQMAQSLGYDFDKVHIRNQSYSPRAHGEIENDQLMIRKGLISLLRGESSLHVHEVNQPQAQLPQLPDARAGTPPQLPDQKAK